MTLRHNKVFHRLAQMTPSLVIQFGLHLVPELSKTSLIFLGNVALAFTILFLVLAISALLNALLDIYARTEHARTRSIKGYVQLTKMVLYVFGAIIIVATLIDRSPLLLLSGLGAMSAVILLVYKDTLLSFVASVQLTSNDMLRVGDWIEMPQVGADGDVVDITLHTVKVQNFDKTIVSIPTWRLMSESFKNWRGMQQSGGRRIKRSLFIDASGVRFIRDDEEQKLSQVHLLTDYISRKQAELKAWNEAQGNVAAMSANRRRMTNIGTFRAYALAYLKSHPEIQPNMTCMVRQMQTTAQGIPLEIYCFTRTTAWADYERIQGDIFDYLLAVLPEFGLSLYQQPSGGDLRAGLLAGHARREPHPRARKTPDVTPQSPVGASLLAKRCVSRHYSTDTQPSRASSLPQGLVCDCRLAYTQPADPHRHQNHRPAKNNRPSSSC